ncbi:unnamed protein product [Hymenolepis diminuta]|uniref:Uncharacterized protein n=1 Tax=Hymenolepis diminuta TaxID=6216 RepID=A0A564YYW4_HYMDI|nr:unnamed protein product [Hymenolepis diminuta]
MFEDLSKKIKVLSSEIEVKMSPEISDTSETTVSPNSSKNSTQSPITSVSPNVLPVATPIEAANDDMKLHSSARNFYKSDGSQTLYKIFHPQSRSSMTCL